MKSSVGVSRLLGVLLLSYTQIGRVLSACTWDVNGRTTLDLTSLYGQTISVTQDSYQYIYTPCRDYIACTDSVKHMALEGQSGACTAELADWDQDISPSYSKKSDTFTFKYENGQTGSTGCSGKRKFTVLYTCDSTSTGIYSLVKATRPDNCEVQVQLYTQYACTESTGSDSSGGGGLSGGSVFLIIFFVLLIVYCIAGYIFNVQRSTTKEWGDYKNHTPHLSFWCLVPKWTWAGCIVTKEFLQEKITGKSTDGYHDMSNDNTAGAAAT